METGFIDAAEVTGQPPAEQQASEKSVLFGSVRRPPVCDNEIRCGLHPAVLESDLGNAWDPGRRSNAEAELQKASRAAQEECQKKLDVAQETRKRNREAREAEREPCLCTPRGAAVLLRESQEQTQKALNLLSAQAKLTEYFKSGSQAGAERT